ncbi:uncharacterized protein VICG_00436 [Vittaforma corneae ATCC 50505]|uniref:Uncharacterized protein n=1 Tax=Vittaforma corneae (strain ATCC 50505) TaxID=993615 RepID=L2GQ08_VITCO|nr:uncharacterized protein VICG_00436 [Vittaforma corneae ATCC 50505]ELA42684.1 hypothetical protein VICG_00436 [Vittaforma corneae ATCC 50505]
MVDQNPVEPTADQNPAEAAANQNPMEPDQVKKVDEKIEQNIEIIKESRIGKAIPRELKNMRQKDLHFIALLIKTILLIPIFMFTFDEGKSLVIGHTAIVYILYVSILADIIVSFSIFFKFINLPAVVRIGVPGFKLLILLIFSIILAISHDNNIFFYFLELIFYLLCIWIEFLHFFYSETKEEQLATEAETDTSKVATEQV